MRLRVGVVGLGTSWETRHGPALRALSDRFEVRAICDPVAHRAQQVAGELNTLAEDGFRALAERQDIDAILLLSEQWYGSLPILAACDCGKAVYSAIALDLDARQATRMKKRIEQAGIAFMAEFPRRQTPATLRLKELIATQLGPPQLLYCHKRRTTAGPDAEPSNGHLRELVEEIDWCRYVVGCDPSSVVGISHWSPDQRRVKEYQMLSLDFSDRESPGTGPQAQISCGGYIQDCWREAAAFRPPAALQVACERGIAFIDLPATITWFDDAGRHLESLENERPTGEQLLVAFYRAATSLVRDTTSLEDAYRAFHIAVQADVSHAEGRRIPLQF